VTGNILEWNPAQEAGCKPRQPGLKNTAVASSDSGADCGDGELRGSQLQTPKVGTGASCQTSYVIDSGLPGKTGASAARTDSDAAETTILGVSGRTDPVGRSWKDDLRLLRVRAIQDHDVADEAAEHASGAGRERVGVVVLRGRLVQPHFDVLVRVAGTVDDAEHGVGDAGGADVDARLEAVREAA
jgi:hypothetical protein